MKQGLESERYPIIAGYSSRTGRGSLCDWSLMDLFVQWRLGEERDGYRESFVGNQILDDGSNYALEIRAQLFSRAACLMDSQHRLFLFAYLSDALTTNTKVYEAREGKTYMIVR